MCAVINIDRNQILTLLVLQQLLESKMNNCLKAISELLVQREICKEEKPFRTCYVSVQVS